MIDNINFMQQIFNDINNAIKILYQKKIMHRDIKLRNIFLKFENKEHTKITAKLGDFGASTFYEIEQKFSDNIGTLYYTAPEILKEETYNYKCDLYSIGVCLYYLVFREFPFKGNTDNVILNQMLHFKTKYLKKTHIKGLDELIEGLLEISPEKRISMEEYLNHPFFKEDLNYLKEHKDFVEEIKSKENEIKKQEEENKQIIENKHKKEEEIIIEKIDEIKNLAQGMENMNIMKISNAYAKNIEDLKDKKVKISNIIYYDENIEKHLDDIHKDSDYFERNTPGTFILCTNIFSLNLIMEEIKSHDKIFLFNLIVTGSKFQKVMDNLIENKYEHFFQNICIYCMKVEKYSHLSKKYNKIKGVYNKAKEIVKFIEDVSSDKIKEFPNLKIVSYLDYKDKYHERHENISQFYGNLSKEIYDIYNKKMENYINSKEQKNFRIEKKKLVDSFKTFDISKDLENLHKLIIHEYTKNTYYKHLNNWLRNFDTEAYEIISYYTARLMYALNYFAIKSNCFYYDKKTLYRGSKETYINLLPLERLKGKIILFSAFTSISESKEVALEFSSREKIEGIYKAKKLFSVIYVIENLLKKIVFHVVLIYNLYLNLMKKKFYFNLFLFILLKMLNLIIKNTMLTFI